MLKFVVKFAPTRGATIKMRNHAHIANLSFAKSATITVIPRNILPTNYAMMILHISSKHLFI